MLVEPPEVVDFPVSPLSIQALGPVVQEDEDAVLQEVDGLLAVLAVHQIRLAETEAERNNRFWARETREK